MTNCWLSLTANFGPSRDATCWMKTIWWSQEKNLRHSHHSTRMVIVIGKGVAPGTMGNQMVTSNRGQVSILLHYVCRFVVTVHYRSAPAYPTTAPSNSKLDSYSNELKRIEERLKAAKCSSSSSVGGGGGINHSNNNLITSKSAAINSHSTTIDDIMGRSGSSSSGAVQPSKGSLLPLVSAKNSTKIDSHYSLDTNQNVLHESKFTL